MLHSQCTDRLTTYCVVTDTRNSFSADINAMHSAAEDNRRIAQPAVGPITDIGLMLEGLWMVWCLAWYVERNGLALRFELGSNEQE